MRSSSVPLPLGHHRARVVEYLRGIALPPRTLAYTIIEHRRHGAESGLLLRPALVLWADAAAGGDGRDALPVAAAFDLFDRFMLLHDELVASSPGHASSPVMRWGLGQSLNAGDALYALALRTLSRDVVDPSRRLPAAGVVTRAVLQAIEGRTRDTQDGAPRAADGVFAHVRSLRRRSAALTAAALESGALVAGASPGVRRSLRRAGRLLDVASVSADPSLAARLRDKAVAAVERCLGEGGGSAAFAEVAAYVVAA
jgi:geranylgeranyl pyrophosphate synthase